MRDVVYVRFDADTAVNMIMDKGRERRREKRERAKRNAKGDRRITEKRCGSTSLIRMLARASNLAR